MRYRSAVKGLLVAAIVALSACSETSNGRGGLLGFGDSILSGLGFSPSSETHIGAPQGLVDPSEWSAEEEYYLGRAVAAQILAKYPTVSDAALTEYVGQVGEVVAAALDNPSTFGGFHFAVLDSKELNAVSAPGGFIFISTGLLAAMPDEDALASVLAHEETHVTAHHGIRSLEPSDLRHALTAAGIIFGSLSCNEVAAASGVVFGVAADKLTNILITQGYSREFEYEADQGATKLLRRAGYDPRGILDALKEVEKFSVRQGGWFATHPAPADRLAKLTATNTDEAPGHSHDRLIRAERFNRHCSQLRRAVSNAG